MVTRFVLFHIETYTKTGGDLHTIRLDTNGSLAMIFRRLSHEVTLDLGAILSFRVSHDLYKVV